MGIIFLLLIVIGIPWLLWYLFIRSVIWVLEPVTNYLKEKDQEKFTIQNQTPTTITIIIQNLGSSIDIPKPIFDRAQHKPSKLSGSDLWIYKDSIMNFKGARDKLADILKEDQELNSIKNQPADVGEVEKCVTPRRSSRKGNSILAITSFVLGLLAIITGFFGIGLYFAIAAVCVSPGGRDSEYRTLAVWGMYLGWFVIIGALFRILFFGGITAISMIPSH